MYMMAHPKDKLETLIESLIKEFAIDIKKHKFDMSQFIVNRAIDFDSLDTTLNNYVECISVYVQVVLKLATTKDGCFFSTQEL